jgi:hypothetical protein
MHIIARPAEYHARVRVIEAMRQVGAALVTELTAGSMNSRDGTLMLFASETHRWFVRVTERGAISGLDQPEEIDQ